MKQAHTSGPWTFTGSINNKNRVTYYIGKPTTTGSAMDHCVEPVGLASNSRLSFSNEECLANARLMAAAPEMLVVLAEIQGECESMVDGLEEATLGVIAMKARKAIAKATEANA